MKKEWATVQIEERGALCYVTLHRPEADNRINVQMVRDLEEVCHHLDDDSPSSVVVLRGAGGNFTRGMDFSEFSLTRPPDIHGFNKWERSVVALERLKKVTIAQIEGACIGGGVQLALACDYRLAVQGAELCLDEVKHGFLPGMATYRLAKYVGLGKAKYLMLTCKTLTAEEALEWGLVDRVCAPERLEEELGKLIVEFLPVNGTVVALARRLLNESYGADYEHFLGSFLAAQARAIVSEPFVRHFQAALRGEG
ncbi:MAG TPA: enoyl-CoA hydratase/isomerase family protein [Candidatus Nitrosotenuis sp.]|nr:enoyl-CoA hydratase/isomerase family protein [Candidatus Nitrosotenuis sp.]